MSSEPIDLTSEQAAKRRRTSPIRQAFQIATQRIAEPGQAERERQERELAEATRAQHGTQLGRGGPPDEQRAALAALASANKERLKLAHEKREKTLKQRRRRSAEENSALAAAGLVAVHERIADPSFPALSPRTALDTRADRARDFPHPTEQQQEIIERGETTIILPNRPNATTVVTVVSRDHVKFASTAGVAASRVTGRDPTDDEEVLRDIEQRSTRRVRLGYQPFATTADPSIQLQGDEPLEALSAARVQLEALIARRVEEHVAAAAEAARAVETAAAHPGDTAQTADDFQAGHVYIHLNSETGTETVSRSQIEQLPETETTEWNFRRRSIKGGATARVQVERIRQVAASAIHRITSWRRSAGRVFLSEGDLRDIRDTILSTPEIAGRDFHPDELVQDIYDQHTDLSLPRRIERYSGAAAAGFEEQRATQELGVEAEDDQQEKDAGGEAEPRHAGGQEAAQSGGQ